MRSCVFLATAAGAECPGHPGALGTSRVITIDAGEHGRIGTMQYVETLPLDEKEVVLTFDDGPLPPYSSRILDILATECARATFFAVGRQARAFPDLVRRARAFVFTRGPTLLLTQIVNRSLAFLCLFPASAPAHFVPYTGH